ncbi:hypothetical protein PS838_03054 [Pseudomonas fluorescens]|nr:hypothetical protein PS838_03054 [Pseudomonas fluorescens]
MQLCEAFEPPQPLLEYQQAPLPYTVEALGELLGPTVERLAEVIGVCCAMAAQSVLASASLVSQGHANVQLDDRTYPLSLYLLTVASSGDRKSAVELTARARRAWIDIHNTIECQSGEFGELAGVQPVASKAAANVLRIAGVLAMVEEASALDEAHIQRASTLMDYYLAEIQRLTEQEPVNS